MRANVVVQKDGSAPPERYILRILEVFTKASKGIPGTVRLPHEFMASLDVRLRRMLERLVMGYSASNQSIGIGNYEAETLIVGNRSSGHDGVDWPFVSVILTGSSGWLAEHLEQFGIPEHALYWVNAYSCNSEARIAPELSKFRRVIALGRHAAEWCAANNLQFTQVHNPAYWKKHHAGKTYILGRTILQEK